MLRTAIIGLLWLSLTAASALGQAPETEADVVVTGRVSNEKRYLPFEVFQEVVWRRYWLAAYDEVGVLDGNRIGRAKRALLDYMAQTRGCDNSIMAQMGRTPESLLQLRALEAALQSHECMRNVLATKSNPKLESIVRVTLLDRRTQLPVRDTTDRESLEAASVAPMPRGDDNAKDGPLDPLMTLTRMREKYRILSYVAVGDGTFVAGAPKQDTLLATLLEPCMSDDVLPTMRKRGPYRQSQMEDVVDTGIEYLARCVRREAEHARHQRTMEQAQVGILNLSTKVYVVLPKLADEHGP
jgi:hypothetical protein